MNIDIECAQKKLLVIYEQTRDIMRSLDDVKLSELQHISDEIRLNRSHPWTLRTAAQITHAAATMEMEKRNDNNKR